MLQMWHVRALNRYRDARYYRIERCPNEHQRELKWIGEVCPKLTNYRGWWNRTLVATALTMGYPPTSQQRQEWIAGLYEDLVRTILT